MDCDDYRYFTSSETGWIGAMGTGRNGWASTVLLCRGGVPIWQRQPEVLLFEPTARRLHSTAAAGEGLRELAQRIEQALTGSNVTSLGRACSCQALHPDHDCRKPCFKACCRRLLECWQLLSRIQVTGGR